MHCNDSQTMVETVRGSFQVYTQLTHEHSLMDANCSRSGPLCSSNVSMCFDQQCGTNWKSCTVNGQQQTHLGWHIGLGCPRLGSQRWIVVGRYLYVSSAVQSLFPVFIGYEQYRSQRWFVDLVCGGSLCHLSDLQWDL